MKESKTSLSIIFGKLKIVGNKHIKLNLTQFLNLI
jgi:hypothetical protein